MKPNTPEPPTIARRGNWPCAYMLLYESEQLLDDFFGPQFEAQLGSRSSRNRDMPVVGAHQQQQRRSDNNMANAADRR